MTIQVTQTDIDTGTPLNGSECPVANAIRRSSKMASVWVGFFAVRLEDKWYQLPKEASRRIRRLDKTLGMKPFCFELNLEEATDYP